MKSRKFLVVMAATLFALFALLVLSACGKTDGASAGDDGGAAIMQPDDTDKDDADGNGKENADVDKDSGTKGSDDGSSGKGGSTDTGKGSDNKKGDSGGTSTTACDHNWVGVYKDVWVDEVREAKEHSICNNCGADITGFESQHGLDAHYGHSSSWHTEVVYTLISEGYFYQELVGYRCSKCGATK